MTKYTTSEQSQNSTDKSLKETKQTQTIIHMNENSNNNTHE
jgi:hypothetical protein